MLVKIVQSIFICIPPKRLAWISGCLALAACAGGGGGGSAGGKASTRGPQFNGQTTYSVRVSSQSYTLNGTCDAGGETLEYSYDQVTWTAVSGGCPSSGKFALDVKVNRQLTVHARVPTSGGYLTAKAIIEFAAPPTSTTLTVLSASSSQDGIGPAVQSASGSVTGKAMSAGDIGLQTYLPGIAYGTP